jgi:hypothetical protein
MGNDIVVKRVSGPGQKKLDALISGLGDREGQVGWFSDAQYENGTPVAYVAAIQEFGSPKNSIPPRSFMRTTVMERRQEWAKIAKDGSKAILNGTIDGTQAMEGLALQAKGDVQAKIASIQEPKLSDLTLALRKVKLGMVPGVGPEVTGKTVGQVAGMLKAGTINTSGVSAKPLIEPSGIPGGGTLYTSIDARVE